MADLRWAPPSRDDDPEWVALLAAIEAVDERGETYEVADLDDEWDSVWSHPETDAQLRVGRPRARRLRLAEGHARAAGGTTRWAAGAACGRATGAAGIGTAAVRVVAAPRHRDRAAASTPALPIELRHRRRRPPARPRRRGRRRRASSRCATSSRSPARTTCRCRTVPARPGLELVPWSAELDEEARLAHVEAFADHWGSEPRTRRGVGAVVHGPPRLPARPLGARRRPGQRPGRVARALRRLPAGLGAPCPVEAWINTVGTRRAWRGKGVARWLMTDVLRRIADADAGFERAILGVDAENPTGALRVYRGLGFAEDVRSVTHASTRTLR